MGITERWAMILPWIATLSRFQTWELKRTGLENIIVLILSLSLVSFTGCDANSVGVAGEQIYVPPPTIDRSGSIDETEALNRYLATVPDNSIISFPESAIYRVEGTLLLDGRVGLTIQGNGAKIMARTDGGDLIPPEDRRHLWPRARSHVEIKESSDIIIRDLVVQGAHPNAGSHQGAYVEALEGQHGFAIRGSSNITLAGVTATDVYGDFVYISKNADRWSTDIHISASHFERSGRQGIAITAAENVLVEHSYIGDVGRSMVDIEPLGPTWGARYVTFLRNTFGPCRHLWVSSGGGTTDIDRATGEIREARPDNVHGIVFESNLVTGRPMSVKVQDSGGLSRRGSHAFINNKSDTFHRGPVPVFIFKSIDGVKVIGNEHADPARSRKRSPADVLVYTCNSTGVEVHDNSIHGFTQGEHFSEAECVPRESE